MMNRNRNHPKKVRKSLLPPIEKVTVTSTPGLSIMFDDDDILTVIDKQHFGRKFFVESGGIYTVRLGVFHDTDKGALEEAAMFCAIPTRASYKQHIIAAFNIPGASTRFIDSIILNAARPFTIRLIPGSPILERHDNQWGVPLKYDSIRESNMTILARTGLRKNVPNQFRAFFDVLSIQIEIMFEK